MKYILPLSLAVAFVPLAMADDAIQKAQHRAGMSISYSILPLAWFVCFYGLPNIRSYLFRLQTTLGVVFCWNS